MQNEAGSLDPLLDRVLDEMERYERSWTVSDQDLLSEMNETMLSVLSAVEHNANRFMPADAQAREYFLESMILVLGFLPARDALVYLQAFQHHEAFFNEIAQKLHSAPPLRDYAKALLGRALALQQRAMQISLSSEENFRALTQALERVLEKERERWSV